MNHIRVLDAVTIGQIAAGEAVERPSSVLKELVENAVDAGARAVTVEIRDGGISLLRVTDDGEGIPAEDVPSAFVRHGTSKIRSAEDLSDISTLGFRGEAIPSIAAVSRMEMITKTKDALTGVRCTTEGGSAPVIEEIGAPDGTTVIVRDLFFNTPARAKFLRSAVTEGARCAALVEILSLSRTDIAFTLIAGGRTRIATAGDGDLRGTVYALYGRDAALSLVPVSHEENGISVTGCVGKPSFFRANRAYENYFVNGRYIKSDVLRRGIEDGYGHRLMRGNYPFTALYLTVKPGTVDVNVHPAKMEVRLGDEQAFYLCLKNAVSKTLAGLELIRPAEQSIPGSALRPSAETAKEIREPFERPGTAGKVPGGKNVPDSAQRTDVPAAASAGEIREPFGRYGTAVPHAGGAAGVAPRAENAFDGIPSAGKIPAGASAEQLSFLTEEAKTERRLVGQVFGTYWLFEMGDTLYAVDQHAAHEKILFEKLMRSYRDREISAQEISPPAVVTLGSAEMERFREMADAIASLGFTAEEFGEREVVIRAVPYTLGAADPASLFYELISLPEGKGAEPDVSSLVLRVATEACKAAVKGGEKLSVREAEEMMDALMKLEDPYHCPHGRPTIVRIGKRDMEKKFGRVV